MIFPNKYTVNSVPSWITNRAMMVYIAVLSIVSVAYSSYVMPWYYLLSGLVSVIVFFYYCGQLTKNWNPARVRTEKQFEKKVFWLAFLLRCSWMLLIYYIFQQQYSDAFGFESGDALFYDEMGRDIADGIRNGNFSVAWHSYGDVMDFSDMGHATYLAVIYYLTNDSIIVARLIKCLWSALTAVLIYRLGKRNFGEDVGRMAAIFCMLWPNYWYYCGTTLKEPEMVFLVVLFVEQADQMMRSRQFTVWKVFPILLIAGALFGFRTALALVSVLALLFTFVMSSSRVVSWGKRIIVGILVGGLVLVTMGDRIQHEAGQLLETVQSGNQKSNMEWRAQRKDAGGNQNKFAKYAGATVFAPLIFSLPFPTMTSPYDGQDVQKLLNGGNFIKNVLSGFVILAILMLLLNGQWRDHLMPFSLLLGYLVVLVFSNFAQAERFHQPATPFEFLFAAYGIQQVLQGVPIAKGIGSRATYRRWYIIWLVITFAACLIWNWFKMAGRGL